MDISTKLTLPSELRANLKRDGFAFSRGLVPKDLIEEFKAFGAAVGDDVSVARRGEIVYGIRDLLNSVPQIKEIVSGSPFRELVVEILGDSARPVYGVYFDKPPGANWPVPWHQDVTIRVREWRDTPGFEPSRLL